MSEIGKLVEVLRDDKIDCNDRLSSDQIKLGLLRFDSIVRLGVSDVGYGKLVLETWSRQQIKGLFYVAKLILSVSVSATVHHEDPIILTILGNTVEFAVRFLERLKIEDGADFTSQEDFVDFLEMALTERIITEDYQKSHGYETVQIVQILEASLFSEDSKDIPVLCNHLLDGYVKALPDSPDDLGHAICNNVMCHWQGSIGSKDKKPLNRVLIALPEECLQSEPPISGFNVHSFSQVSKDIMILLKHFGVFHAKCLPRLLLRSKELLQILPISEEISKNLSFQQRILFGIRILKLLGNLTEGIPYIPYNSELLNAVTCYGDSLVGLFHYEFEYIHCDTVISNETIESQLLLLLQEFIQLVQIIFSDGSIFQNIRVCMVAKMLCIFDVECMESRILMSSNFRLPLAYCPKIISHLLYLIREVRYQPTHEFKWNEKFGTNPHGFTSRNTAPSWNIFSKKVYLLQKYTTKEHHSLIFPPSDHWLDNLIRIALFLQSEGVKLRMKFNGVHLSHTKSIISSDQEDEALFGDLFSEVSRPVGSSDAQHEQLETCSNTSSGHDITYAAIDILNFLKMCIFCPEWSRNVYNDACKRFNKIHISYLISILSSQMSLTNENTSNTAASLQFRLLMINQECFELFRNLLVQGALSATLEEYIVDQVLKVENGKYGYNDYTLTLLANVLFFKDSLSLRQLATKAYTNFVNFITEKAQNKSNHLDLKDSIGTLPSVFHLEILLMTFHLSCDSDKAALASYVLRSIKDLDPPLEQYISSYLSYWGLLVSRLVLMVQHFVLYPSTCPSWLLLQLRSILNDPYCSNSKSFVSNSLNDHLASWTSKTVMSIMGDVAKCHSPVSNSLLPQLIDFNLFSSTTCLDDVGYQGLGLDCNDFLTSLIHILSFWDGMQADMLEDLIIERYMFLLCWDTFSIISSVSDVHVARNNRCMPDSLSNESFFLFGHFLLSNSSISHDKVIPHTVVIELFQMVHSQHIYVDSSEQGWDFLRKDAWLSLLLSILDTGLSSLSVKNEVSHVQPYLIGHVHRDNLYSFAEKTIEMIFRDNKVGWLLNILSSSLKLSLQAFQEAFIYVFNDIQSCSHDFSPVLLLKHTVFDKSKHDVLLEKCNSKSLKLESVFCLLSKLDGLLKKRNNDYPIPLILDSLLHGFPLFPEISSAILVSCALNVQAIVSVLHSLLKFKSVDINHIIAAMEKESFHILIESVMVIRSDLVFQNVHEKCETICSKLCASICPKCEKCEKYIDYRDFFQLKQIEGFLKFTTSSQNESDCFIHEMLVVTAIDLIDSIRRDHSKEVVFKFFFGASSVSEAEILFDNQHVDLLVIINALDRCPSEAVNTKILNFFVDLLSGDFSCPTFNEKLLRKFISFDLICLSKWLEFRLLGRSTKDESGNVTTKGVSPSLRVSTMDFVTCLLSQHYEALSSEFHFQLIEAMLASLHSAFLSYDFYTAKTYFNFIVRLINGKPFLRTFLEKVLLLMQKLSDTKASLLALKFLVGFLGSLLTNCGGRKNILEKLSGKIIGTSSSAPFVESRQLVSIKSSKTMILPAAQEGSSALIDCDAMSVDEDEDDGTTDGELASQDKEEEEDNNCDKALASKVCTFASSGSNFMEQHWYFCYTCDLTVSKGCCSVCAKVCHRGHRVVYSRSSRFFCDCGAGGVRGSSCHCLKPRKLTGSNSSAPVHISTSLPSFLPFSEEDGETLDTDSDMEDDVYADIDSSIQFSLPNEIQDGISTLLEELCMEDQVLKLCESLLPTVINKRDSTVSKDKNVILKGDKVVYNKVDMFQLKKSYKSGLLDLKIRGEYSNSRELKCHLSSGSLTKSLLSANGRGRLAVGEGDKVAIFDIGLLISQSTVAPVKADKSNIKPLSKNIVRFEIVHLMFNAVMGNFLAVAGYQECQILTVNPRGEVTDRLAIELALQGGYIRRVDWVPGSQVQLLVVTNLFVKIYDLSLDNISPLHYFTLADNSIMDATLIVAPMGRMFLLVLSEQGSLFRLELSLKGNVGAKVLNEIVDVPRRDTHAKGLSLYFSHSYRLLFLSYQDGTTLIGRLDNNATMMLEISALLESELDGKLRPVSLHHWKDLSVDTGVFVCFSNLKQNAAVTVSLCSHDISMQSMQHTMGSSALPSVGITSYKPLSKDKTHCLVLYEDGSLQIYSHASFGIDTSSNVSSDHVKKIGASILSNKAYASINQDFPLDFFEKTTCITNDVKLSCEAIKNDDSEELKQKLATDDGFLESPTPVGFKMTVLNSNPDIVMVGFRLHVGNTSASHIPSSVSFFQRVVKLDEGMRSWYDIPFTTPESILADEEFTVSVGSSFNGSTLPRIDFLEVYGRAKEEFGWKEKMDALLDMEANTLGPNSSNTGIKKKHMSVMASPIEEQLLADALNLLSKFYSKCKPHSCLEFEEANSELTKLKCKKILELIFQCDREAFLQSAACHVLRALFPKREIYYHVKDTMHLFGVVNSSPILASKIGIGSGAAAWVIKEFVAKTRAVSKIALLRTTNLATFLEMHGSGVVDGLMQVFWGILDYEQPDTPTINSIVIPCVELIYSYAECLGLHGIDASGNAVAPAVKFLKKLLFAPYETVQTSSSLAISSRLLQVPFPKQTMLTTDEIAEPHPSIHLRHDTIIPSGRITQSTIEDDSGNSSVQYCCDGCSTVPILRRRWHCNVCPDFDLCEACYEVLDADRLPPPHSSDHRMSAIPIEIDTPGGDGNEFQFSMDDLNDASLAQISTDIRPRNASSFTPAPVSELSETGDFPAVIDQSVVSISASKRAVNSLLLRHLIAELKGWMETTSGIRAIPVMQFFYRLSSAVGGPFMDSSKPDNLDLEKFVKWFLDEINLDIPFVAKKRTFLGEISILVFMFFTFMLRNWHLPGSDSSQSKSSTVTDTQDKCHISAPSSSQSEHDKDEFASQLILACSFLRQQTFVNYLMDILQQLIQYFKPSHMNSDGGQSLPCNSGCGSLLFVRKELPAGNFSPFFSDSYAKAHRTDLFLEFHKLLLENTFRLVYSLVRPEKHKTTEKDKIHKTSSGKDLKLDGYHDVLCSYISNPQTAFVRRYARRLFLHMCGSKTQYYSNRDLWHLSNEVKRLHKLVDKSGGFQNTVPYERSVKLVKCLSGIVEIAVARPKNWQKYCSKHREILSFLMNGVFDFGEESVVQALKLLNLALYTGKDMIYPIQMFETCDTGSNSSKSGSQSTDLKKKRKVEDASESNTDKFLDMEHAVEIFCSKDSNILNLFIDTFLLEWNSTNVRSEAKCVLYGAWHHGKQSFREILLTALLQKISFLPMYGQNIVEYTELLTLCLGKVFDIAKHQDTEIINHCLTTDAIHCIFETLHSQNELLANHPNSRIYNTLSSLVEFDGYYLESEPCVACSCPEVPYTRMKLETLKFETKYTDNRIIVKCTGSYTIQSMIMNVHDARKSKSVKVLNLYYNNKPVSDLSELKNNWSLWKRAKSCHLALNQTELKVDFSIPITACNFMIELDSFYDNLQASSLESLQCPRCSRSVTDKHGICSNCHENAYQCRQCRNINYENLDSFLCNECGYSKYGRFEFNFMARPSFVFDSMENDEDMKKGLTAIESESENAHRRYQQLMGFKKPLLKLVSSIGEQEIDSQHKDTVQQMMVSLPGPSCKINRKIALLGVLYGEKCKSAFDSVSKSVQTLQGLRRVLMNFLQQKKSGKASNSTKYSVPRSSNNCYGCAITFVSQCMELLQVLSKHPKCKKQLVASGILSELFENNIHQGPKSARVEARSVLCAFSEGDFNALTQLNSLIQKKIMYCLEHHRSMDIAVAIREEIFLLSEVCSVVDEFWEARLRVAFQLLFASIRLGSRNPAISEQIILPCLRIISQVCTPHKSDALEKEQAAGRLVSTTKSKNDDSFNCHSVGIQTVSEASYKNFDGFQKDQEMSLMSYSEWEKGASYLDFVRRKYKISQTIKATSQKPYQASHRYDYLALKYGLKWKRTCCKKIAKSEFSTFELGSWVSELILSPCSQSIRAEVCSIICLLYPQNLFRQFQLLNLLMMLLPETLSVGESAAEYFELFSKMIDSHTARLFLTAKGCLVTICRLITKEVSSIESQESSLNIDISQGFILHKLVEILSKFLEVSNIRCRFMREELLSQVLESLLVIRGLIVQKTKLISDCNKLLKDLLDGLLVESRENKRQFIRACISGLQIHGKEKKGRTCLFILEQLCNMICPSKPEPVYLLILNKTHTQEEFIRGSMTKNPYSSTEIGPLMRDVKNKICILLDLLGLVEDDYGMELLVAGNIISLDLSISQVYEQVWRKSQSQIQNTLANVSLLASGGLASTQDCPPMTVTYRLQGLDGEATEPMIKELEEEREESQDPEVEFAIAGSVREFGGLEIILSMIQHLRDNELKSNQEEMSLVLNLLMYCCKIRENRQALLRLGALGLLLETARRAFSIDAMEPAEGILLIVESLTMEANDSDVDISRTVLTVGSDETGAGEQAKKIVNMFLERLCHSSGLKKTNKQQRNNEMVARILPCLTYGESAAMETLIKHFDPYLHDWNAYDLLQKKYLDNPKDENLAERACKQKSEVENFLILSESLDTSSCGERLKDIILQMGITEIAVRHLRETFAFIGIAGFKTSIEWQNGLSLPSVPVILSILRGLSRGHFATQSYIDEGAILPLLHTLEGVSGENGIGAKAENLLDMLSDKENNGDGFLGVKVCELRHATRNEMRQRALRKREELLQDLGMRQELSSDGGERIIVAQPLIEGLEDVEEEKDGLACMVCREGYTLRPNDMLGVYSFSKRVNLGAGSPGSVRGECVFTTVSHFNIIHFQCHQEAKRVDAALKTPKKEWDGATLRNNETLCNCIFPLRGPSVPLSQYVRCVDQYWDNLNALGRSDGSRLRLLTYDIVMMLARFATRASFSTDSKGGGKESNSRLVPFMLQMACHLFDQGNSSIQQRRSMAKSISSYLSISTTGTDSPSKSMVSVSRASSGSSDDTVQFMMVNSLLSESYDEWREHLPIFLQQGIYHAYKQHTHGRSTLRLSSDPATSPVTKSSDSCGTTEASDSSKLFSIIQPMLVYTGLIEQLQRFLKKSSRPLNPENSKVSEGAVKGGSSSSNNFEAWEVIMREKLVNMKEMVGLSKELLSWLDDMSSAMDMQEAFDVMGALGVALSGGFSSCGDFVQAALDSGKS